MWRKSTLAALFLFCTMFFVLSMTAAAEEVGGVWKADEIWGEADAEWSYNTETKTLTVSGTGHRHVRSVPWEQFENDVEVLVVNGDIFPRCWPKKKVTVNFSNGFQWNYDVVSNTATISGKGEFPETKYVLSCLESELKQLIIEDGITSVDNLLSQKWIDADIITLGKDIKNFSQKQTFVNDLYIVPAENPHMTVYDDCLYTKDYRTLIGCPRNKESIKFPQGVQIIGENALRLAHIKTLIIPWGVTTLEPSSIIIYSPANPYPPEGEPIPKVILPDTILVNKVIFSERTPYLHFCYSKNNKVMDEALAGITRQYDRDFHFGVKLDSVAEYYPEAAAIKTGWQEENGKKFYYNANGQKVSGWQKIGAAWYWFAADGVMATNQWLTDQGTYWVNGSGIMVSNNWIQVKGSWYYLLGDGRRAENRWVYARDKKWYYLGKGGVMLTNTTTPDGYRVDKNGVWMK